MEFVLQKILLLLLMNLATFSSLCSQALWECNDNLLTLVGSNLGIHVSSMYDSSIEIEEIILNLSQGSIPVATNAVGYRKKEDAIYGIKYENNQQILFKMTVSGELTDLYFFSDDEIISPLAGCMSSDDDHLLILTAGDNILVSIDLQDGFYTQSSSVVEGLNNYALFDIAINPMNGLLYGIAIATDGSPEFYVATIDPSSGQLLEINEFINHESMLSLPSVAITSNEILIAYNMGQEDVLVYYHIPTKTIINFITDMLPYFEDEFGNGADGCSCLSGIVKLQKFYSQDTITQCRKVSLTYRILNYDIDNTDNYFLITDTLASGLNIDEIIYNNSEYDINIESDSIINISRRNGLKYGLDSIVFLVSANENTLAMSFESQAVLYNCMDVGNDCSQIVTKSDDPKYPDEENNPTSLTVSGTSDESPPQINNLFYKCADSTITLNLFPSRIEYEIEWGDGIVGNGRSFDQAGIYPVIIRDNCNEYELDIHIIESSVNVEMEPNYQLIYGTTVEIFSSVDSDLPLESQYWYLDTLLIASCVGECSSISLSAQRNQVLKTKATNEVGCVDVAFSILRISAPIYAPTAFSPNQDGHNDIYYLRSEADILVKKLEIYDRWGGCVFSKEYFNTNDEASGWDGTERGKKSPIGTYVWFAVIEIDGESLKVNGEINLVK